MSALPLSQVHVSSGSTASTLSVKTFTTVASELSGDFADREQAGYCFLCNNDTVDECFRLNLVGCPQPKLADMKNLPEDAAIFLLNTESKEVHGMFEPDGKAAIAIVPEAWQGRFPAQLRFRSTDITAVVDSSELSWALRGGFIKPPQVEELMQTLATA